MATGLAALSLLPTLLGAVPFGFLVVYLVLRWRDREARVRDPQIGVKSAVLLFRQVALLLILAGATMVGSRILEAVAGRLSSEPTASTGLALLVANGIVWAAADRALRRTNAGRFPRPTRMFLGSTAVLSGLVGIAAFSVATASLFTGKSLAEGALAYAATLVWGPAAILLLRSLLRRPQDAAGEDAPRPAAEPVA